MDASLDSQASPARTCSRLPVQLRAHEPSEGPRRARLPALPPAPHLPSPAVSKVAHI